ncbi:hypothetical protein EL09_15395 [Salmonella enterica subsp. enterica]|nr:hypothetical protein [Salmonella enterica subsp. enterica]MIF51099.1 hypothetical protein [Salmonella enterica subsp. enterica]
MNIINTKLETLQAAQIALRDALYDFQDTLLDRLDDEGYYHDVNSLLEDANKYLNLLERNIKWAATYMPGTA